MAKARKGELTPRQELFCHEWLKDFDCGKAAIRAGYSKKTAARTGSENLYKPLIKRRIAEIQEELRKKALNDPNRMATPAELLHSYTRDVRFDPRRLFNENKELLPIPDLPEDIALSLVGIDTFPDGRVKYKFPNKNQVRDSVARLLGLTNGNSDIIKTLLEALGMIQINVQNNQYNLNISGDLQRAIEHSQK
jgi:phage terminase small subunit